MRASTSAKETGPEGESTRPLGDNLRYGNFNPRAKEGEIPLALMLILPCSMSWETLISKRRRHEGLSVWVATCERAGKEGGLLRET